MSKWITPFLIVLIAGCTGELTIGDPDVEVTQLNLSATPQNALQAEACVLQRGESACAQYPNPRACDRLVVSVRGDGSTVGHCEREGQPRVKLEGIIDGIPIACRMDYENGCIQCADVYGGAVVDTCDRKTQLFSGEGFQSDKTGTPVPDQNPGTGPGEGGTPQTGPDTPGTSTPPGDGGSTCDDTQVKKGFVDRLNKLLTKEGFKFTWSPDMSKIVGDGFFGDMGFHFADEICKGDGGPGVQDDSGCDADAVKQGRCYCEEEKLMGVSCRCSRMTADILREMCKAIPADCDQKAWAVNIWKVHGEALKYLNGGPLGAGFNPLGQQGGVSGATGPGDVMCKGSPLVLDLAGDGVELSSAAEGVSFNLMNHGPMRTAWVRGHDDALLALDRDGDGVIGGGQELFGEGAAVDGHLARDGFEALAALDRPDHGGNGNGLLERDDLMFDQLVLWTDRNHDGASQADELRPLLDAGISALQIQGQRGERVLDGHGNDLSLRARYLRADGGTGLLVDVLLVH
jgi:hypothetical protein